MKTGGTVFIVVVVVAAADALALRLKKRVENGRDGQRNTTGVTVQRMGLGDGEKTGIYDRLVPDETAAERVLTAQRRL